MNSYIYIEGAVLALCTLIFFLTLLMLIFIGCSNLKLERENEQLKIKNKKLRRQLSFTEDELFNATLKNSNLKIGK